MAAAERNGINLGTTSFFDGFGGDKPGCTYIQYIGHDTFNSLHGANGQKEAVPTQLDVNYIVPQLACSSDYKLFGGALGWNTIVPFAEQDSGNGALVPGTTNGGGLGDILVGPTLTFAPIMRDGRPVFAQSFEFDIIAPTGKYDASNERQSRQRLLVHRSILEGDLPSGSGLGNQLAPQLHPQLRSHQTTRMPLARSRRHPCCAMATASGLNFAASKEIFKDFYFGVNGYWLKQLAADTGRR